MKRTIFLFLIAATLYTCEKPDIETTLSCSNYGNYDNHPKAVQFRNLLNECTKKGLPGISLLVRDSSGIWAGASGKADISSGIDFQTCHVSKTASITKMFTGVIVFKLIEDGILELDKLASTWLPSDIVNKVTNLDKVTLRHLLNHTTGIYDVITDTKFYLQVLNDPDKLWTQEDLLKYVYNKPAYFPPGEKAKYSNTNTLLVSKIIDEATGEDHSGLMHTFIFEPLGLNYSYYYWHDRLPSTVAQGYYDLYNNGQIHNVTNYNTGSGNGYGGLYSTVFDMQVFIEALFREKTLLSENSLNQMMQFVTPEEETDVNDQIKGRQYGLGIIKDFLNRTNPDEFAYGHRGRDLGYSGDLFYFPNQDITMSLLVNYGTDGKTELRETFFAFRKDLVDLIME